MYTKITDVFIIYLIFRVYGNENKTDIDHLSNKSLIKPDQ